MSLSDAASSDPNTDPEMSTTAPSLDYDGDGFDFSLCGDDYISDNCKQFLSLPGKELHTADMEQFDTYVGKVKVRPRMEYEGEPPFNAAFWAKIQGVLQQSRPPGLDDLRDREQLRAQGI